MTVVFESFLAGFPFFILHFLIALTMFVLAVYIYEKITPYREMEMVRKGNVSAAITFSAGILGLAIPLAFCLAGSVNHWDIIIWGLVALIVQIFAFYAASFVIDDLKTRIENDEIGAAILLFSGKISVAMINAAAIAV
jgi:putative membrane protein